MRNDYFFQLHTTAEQIDYAKLLVEHSLLHHKIPNIWDGTNREKETVELRFTGTLGEVVFADAYQLARPLRSFGAEDGQDYGKDFELKINQQVRRFDLKTMRRKNNQFYQNYVLNIPASQLLRNTSQTDDYFHISLHPYQTVFVASFVGYAPKKAILNGEIGQIYEAGAWRIRNNGTKFQFLAATYEIPLWQLHSPPITPFIAQQEGFALKHIQ